MQVEMSSRATKKIIRTYSRQAKRPLYENGPPTKRRRVESIPDTSEFAESTPDGESNIQNVLKTCDSSDPATSSPKIESAIFSDEPLPSSPPSSPTLPSSPIAIQKRKSVFALFQKQNKSKASTKSPLSERSHNAQTLPKPKAKKTQLVQMQLDLAMEHRKTCKTCGMEYIPSNPEDAALHRKFHAMNLGGVDFSRPVIERLRKNQIWSGGDASFITVVGRKDALALRNRASDVLKVVNTELAAVPISDEDLWSRAGNTAFTEGEADKKTISKLATTTPIRHGSPLVDRFKMYLYIRGTKCVGACLAERIWEAYPVLGQDDASDQQCQLPAAPQSSSISISALSDPAIMGVSRIWTSNQHRKQAVATKLLDTARANFLYGLIVEKKNVAFSQPTESGGKLAKRWFGCAAGWHVYVD